ncbi:MAG: hypothetical protein ACYCVX_09800 [Thiobacillus sp.]
MMVTGLILGVILWWLLRQGNPHTRAYRVRRFVSWFALLLTAWAGAVAAGQRDTGAGLVLGGLFWLAAMLVLAAPSTLVYYLWKVRRS